MQGPSPSRPDQEVPRKPRLGPRLQKLKQTLTAKPLSNASETVEAVVGILLLEKLGSGIEVLLIQRPERTGDPWSGQVGFPGGRIKSSDSSPREALHREVKEEVGIDLASAGEELGALSIGRPGRNPEVRVQPWSYAVGQRSAVSRNDEVQEGFWATLPELPWKQKRTEVEVRGQKWMVDCFLVDGHVVWGFTFRVLSELMQIPEVMAR